MNQLTAKIRPRSRLTLLLASLLCVWPVGRLAAEETSTLKRIERLNPHLDKTDPRELPLKIRTLMLDEYMFFRGAIDLYHEWARQHCTDWYQSGNPVVLLHGDVHIGNVGTYQTKGAFGEELGFCLVDLDEVFEGPFQLDLLRGATALRCAVAANEMKISEDDFAAALKTMLSGYRDALTAPDSKTDYGDFVAGFVKDTKETKLAKYVAKYADVSEAKFNPCRMKKDKPSDILEPVEQSLRTQLVTAIGAAFKSARERAVPAFGIESQDELAVAIKDVVRWTRVESSGSQGLHKYLVLLEVRMPGDNEHLILELKQEPRSANARSLPSKTNLSARALDVAMAYGEMFEPDAWFVSHTRAGGREFLVRLKDPWGEELEADMIKDTKDVNSFAAILGKAVGSSHRNVLRSRGDSEGLSRLAKAADSLEVTALQSRSLAAEEFLRTSFKSLNGDPQAKAYAEVADEFIENACPEKPKKEKKP